MSEPSKVIVIESHPDLRQKIATLLEFIDFNETVITDASAWQAHLQEERQSKIVILGPLNGFDSQQAVMDAIKAADSGLPVLVLVEQRQQSRMPPELLKNAFLLISTPLKYVQLSDALHQAQLYNLSGRQGGGGGRNVELFRSLVGHSRAVRKVRQAMEQVANSEATVLILGESGTGKEVVARNLHYYSDRRDKPFVPVNCGAIPGDLLESELFGHEKGAFTGAISARQGRFELADGGTLFLDEIGDMSMPMQVKLLRVLQERTFERVGSNKSISSDVRIIAATHRDLETLIRENKFREDLYYRLNVFPIDMPPLRERIEDIPLLVNELIARIEHEKRGSIRLTQAALMALCQYRWPGNVRELSNLIERLVIMYPYGVVDIKDLPEKFRSGIETAVDNTRVDTVIRFDQPATAIELEQGARLPREGIDLKEHLNNLELSLIRQALDEADGVVAHAAKKLNMRRTTLVEKLRKYGITRHEGMSRI